ncbi:hypothetical protein FHS16_004274 [Paenibacillus endophyticus]|uniref:Uncharacterized protein n=1 Tax=Paenibacillus endophyticus TaxID=1294268 RepID=A0A7W5CAM9_9BACL|nr:hypothetical protein [Paenibacillus endophyticus]
MFKVGMTRRLDPLARIDELGDAWKWRSFWLNTIK